MGLDVALRRQNLQSMRQQPMRCWLVQFLCLYFNKQKNALTVGRPNLPKAIHKTILDLYPSFKATHPKEATRPS